ncbi:hypothetical protein CKA81_04465 [Pollutimonas thiosulfatoxidans]|uniref:Uncharacterized protein n=1 Tax=Pollutimonas thiosulfatoxidans TaxID=2028345 RepID=A0A410GA44_9BURK|nr:hypothetical protein CKA81_04465 [Pollutimonas thiosulfatoxidans]
MEKYYTSLGDDILAVFKRACNEGDLHVAEHLLRALETMADRAGGDERMERAYLQVARSLVDTKHRR